MKTLKPDLIVDANVVDGFVDVLNFEEKYRADSSPYRLFCGTNVVANWMRTDGLKTHENRMEVFTNNMVMAVCGDIKAADLRAFDMVFIPIKDNDNYFLCTFDLKYPAITVMDSYTAHYPLATVRDGANYMEKSTAYQVKELFVRYLEQVDHPKAAEMERAKINRLQVAWATKNNEIDTTVFTMRHMETYMGIRQPFATGFARHGGRKKTQLNALRMKYAYKILMSPANMEKEHCNTLIPG